LSVYEVKGLEFDDVILYNFFTNSQAKHLWKILDEITIDQVMKMEKEIDEEEEKDFLIEKEDDMPGEVSMKKQDSTNPGVIINSTMTLENERGIGS
jgi:hypothetical protein